jgi:hypothetical protein
MEMKHGESSSSHYQRLRGANSWLHGQQRRKMFHVLIPYKVLALLYCAMSCSAVDAALVGSLRQHVKPTSRLNQRLRQLIDNMKKWEQ